MSDILINIKHKHYDSTQHDTIENLKFSLPSNEFICLIGPSGCGKTTLLNIIAQLDNDFEGEISQDGQALHPNIGYIFQNPRLLPWRTVKENIELVLNQGQSFNCVNLLLKSMQLEESKNKYPEHLSLGMSRRVSIIRAFAINPKILLMDEPFVSLDAPTARQVRELLIKLWLQRPHTILFVTHDLREAITLADRLVFLSPSPMSVISEIKVDIARENRNSENEIEGFRQKLLQNYPEINDLL
ncbi:MAG: ABC transporter ATP-binding protein [Methylococcales symbiont of Iophon sp. n. MRB-2018]|nr:MAG: ABC transporter ATP-binding protein [Methylococcales symbiont of Iophon sp. n. MRB-2018]KAF3980259.1 MAG: ABC transporter ATP-binding protein [Methylococcales symbiont of Iophon sp. n. MRB-2018]